MNKEKCLGCTDDFYNGKNDLGIRECYRLSTATVVMRKRVPLDQKPPWTQKAELLPLCYRKGGFVFVDKDRTC